VPLKPEPESALTILLASDRNRLAVIRNRAALTLRCLGQNLAVLQNHELRIDRNIPPPPCPSATEALIVLSWSYTVASGEVVILTSRHRPPSRPVS